MTLRFHPHIQRDINRAQRHYDEIDHSLGDDFWEELSRSFERIASSPNYFHVDSSGWRRCGLNRFPYHILFKVENERVKVMTVRHDHQNPEFGTRRR